MSSCQNEEIMRPGDNIRPQLCRDIITRLMEDLYGLKVSSYRELNSYTDRNVHVQVDSCWRNPELLHLASQGYVLKVLNSLDSKKQDFIEAQHAMIFHILEHGVLTPFPVRNIHGQLMSLEKIPLSGDCGIGVCMVRLFEYVPGKLLLGQPYTPSLLFNLGEFAGRMDSHLKTFHHPALDIATNRVIWCLTEVPRLRQFLYVIADHGNASLVVEVIEAFEQEVVAQYHLLQKGAIHGDLNEHNVLLENNSDTQNNIETQGNTLSSTLPEHHVHAILDFGDSSQSYFVFEIAILICYMMLDGTIVDEQEVGGHVLAGYLSQFKLNDTEKDVLKECICGRLVQSLVMGAYAYSQDSSNSYVLHTATRGWQLLRRLWETPKHKLYTEWQQIVDYYI